MGFKEDGTWEPEDDSVQTQLSKVTAAGGPLMTQAGTRGKQTAARRGLMNTSMGVQAGEQAMLNVALPVASQQAKQISDKNLTRQDYTQRKGLLSDELASRERISTASIASGEREKATGAVAAMENIYGDMFRTIASNEQIPAATRKLYTAHMAAIRDSNLNLVEQLYGIDLDWATTVGV